MQGREYVEMSEQSRRGPKNKEAVSFPFLCLEDLLAHHARLARDRTAIVAPNRGHVTYGTLWGRVNNAVRELRSLGVGRDERVAVVLRNGPESAIATIAVAVGAICVPLNPDFTANEWQRYFGDLRVTALLTSADLDSASRGVAHALGMPVIDLSPRPGEGPAAFGLVGAPKRPADGSASKAGADEAFVLLTSGTTSRPKVVPLTHANVCRSAHNAGAALQLGPRDRLLNMLPLFHAHGLFSGLLAALSTGSSVVCMPGFDAEAFFAWLTEFQPTWYTAVPTIHQAVLTSARRQQRIGLGHSLRLIRSASSSLPPDVLGGLEALFGVPVIETYGMTEAASQIAANPVPRRKLNSVGVSAGAEIAIMDSEGRSLSAGQMGEIALRGPTLMQGYDNDASSNAEAFRDGWFRTGDLGYLDEDGYLFIRGRLKDIINRGGQKVAPAEVEETLLSHPDVVEVAAFSIPHARLGEDVAAAAVLRAGVRISPRKLRDFARERLTGFKVPNVILIVPEIPKSPSGKINRSKLPAMLAVALPTTNEGRGAELLSPNSDLERELVRIWSDLLEIRRIGIKQDVFALGADSLTVMQMLSRLRARFGVNFSFKDVLDAPTVVALAARIEASERDLVSEPLRLRDARADASTARLSFQQQRIHVLSKLDPVGHIYHVIEIARLRGPLDPDALEASIATVCRRHEVLRSTFPECAGEPMQTVGIASPRLERLDLGPCAEGERGGVIQRQAQQVLHQPFDMEKQPLLRARLLRLDEDDHALVIKLHHIVTDGWSQRLFWEEIEALYEAALRGAPARLPDLPVQYRHFSAWQLAWLKTRAAEEQRSYWRAQLDGLSELPLRTDRPRPERSTGRGARQRLRLSRNLTRRIRSLNRAHRVTMFMTLLAAFQCLLYRYTGHEDLAMGSLIANRNQIDAERLIGMFANTIILRTDLSGDPSFAEVLRRVRRVTMDAHRNQDLPIEEIFSDLQASRSLDRQALFRSMFILHNRAPRAPALKGLVVRFVDVDPGTARTDLMLELIETDDRLEGWLEYSTDLFDAATMARMAAHLPRLLEAVAANPEEQISRLSFLPERERRRLMLDWNDTRKDFGNPRSFFRRFVSQAKRTPEAVAVSQGPVRLSYQELERRSTAIASRLVREGVGPNVVVILLAERNIDFLAAMIGVLRAGGAFLPLDQAVPQARLARIVDRSGALLVLVGQDCTTALEAALSRVVAKRHPKILSLEQLVRARPRNPAPPARNSPSSLAYVIYTSGSTGVPKGAMVEQRGMINHLLSQISDLELSASDVIAQTAPQSFVLSVWQFLTPLMIGARVHICGGDEVRDPALLAETIERERVTVLQIVPALLRQILQLVPDEPAVRSLSQLRVLACCGEALPPELLREWLRHFPGVPVVNAYGSTECSDDVASHRLVAAPASLTIVPIGRPIANTSLYVLDANLKPLPIGVAGELYVGGIGVGRGYLNDPEQTGKRFLRDPFSNQRAARLYRTGDLACWRADGTLEFLGRIDHQVKIRGYRIELTEIEYVLLEHPDVQSAIVQARDVAGEARLVAHVVAAADRHPEVAELRDFLKSRLPAYMVPAGFIFLDHMPLTSRGKVDRSALAAIRQAIRMEARVAPRNSTEEALVDIWADLLKVENIGIFDNFFDLGGHSLLAGQVRARIENALGVRLPVKVLFEATTIEALARQVDARRDVLANEPEFEIAHVVANGPPPVSFAQEHVLRIERDLPGLPEFNLRFGFWLHGPLDIAALEQSLGEVMRRHDSLRAQFIWQDERLVTVVRPSADLRPPLSVDDLSAGMPEGGAHSKALLFRKAELLAQHEALTLFDTTRAPLFRVRLLRIGTDYHLLLLVVHHAIVDGWSIGVFIEELAEYYSAISTGRQTRLPEPTLQFSDFAHWQRQWSTTASANQQFAYWRERLRGASPVFPMNGGRRGAMQGSSRAHEPIDLPKYLAGRLVALSRSHGATLFMTLLTGFKALMLARCERNDICIAVTAANRTDLANERVIGPFVNTLLIRTRLDADASFKQALDLVRESVVEAYARQQLPFDILASRLAQEEGLDLASLHQVVFDLQEGFQRPLKLPNVTVRPIGNLHREQPLLPIDISWLKVTLRETPSGITGSCSYKHEMLNPNTVKAWLADYKTVLANATANPQTPLGRLADTR
jgi:amino acid adenylation domain-containing protein